MAEYKLAAALNASLIPFNTRYQQRPVLIAGLDSRLRSPSASPQSFVDNNPQNLPQILYAENVMPTSEGVKSVGYTLVQAAWGTSAADGVADDVFIIRDGTENSWFYSPAQGMNYVTSALGTPWVSTSPLAGAPFGGQPLVSLANVNGVTYVCFANIAILRWNGVNFTDVSAMFTGGVNAANTRAICGAGNYLVLISTDNSVKWSSLTDPLDFVPSVATGAGSQIPLDMRGPPINLSTISGGFLVHCTENVVAAVYTQNSAQPWIFREVKNSGGSGFYSIARETGLGAVYAYGGYGLQALNLREAETVHADLSDFLSNGVFEEFNTATNQLTNYRSTLFVKLAVIAGRFLCVSYGASGFAPFPYIVVYDMLLKRWGKLKIDHADVFYDVDNTGQFKSMYIITTLGACHRVTLDGAAYADSGVVILGRYQLNRTNQICSQELELEVMDGSDNVTAHVATNYNGTTVGQILAMTAYAATDNYRCFQKQIEGENLSYILKGSFHIATALFTFTKGAKM